MQTTKQLHGIINHLHYERMKAAEATKRRKAQLQLKDKIIQCLRIELEEKGINVSELIIEIKKLNPDLVALCLRK